MITHATRPDWASDGAEVYLIKSNWSGNPKITRATVLRATKTQIVVRLDTSSQLAIERRFRLSNLSEVGMDYHDSPELCPPTDPRIQEALDRKTVSRAMEPLRIAIANVSKGALIYRNDTAQALAIATAIRDAAQQAIDAIQANP